MTTPTVAAVKLGDLVPFVPVPMPWDELVRHNCSAGFVGADGKAGVEDALHMVALTPEIAKNVLVKFVSRKALSSGDFAHSVCMIIDGEDGNEALVMETYGKTGQLFKKGRAVPKLPSDKCYVITAHARIGERGKNISDEAVAEVIENTTAMGGTLPEGKFVYTSYRLSIYDC